jgi:hypothetical protein
MFSNGIGVRRGSKNRPVAAYLTNWLLAWHGKTDVSETNQLQQAAG